MKEEQGVTVAFALAYARLNDHKMPGEVEVTGPLTRACLAALAREVVRLQAEAAVQL